MSKENIFWFIAGITIASVIHGFLTYPEVVYEDREVIKEVEISRREESTRACVARGGVPTYSAWDGDLNGCLGI